MHDEDDGYPFENPFTLPDWDQTHTLIVDDNHAGIGIEDVKGHIWLRLNPAYVLNWHDRLDIKVVPQKEEGTKGPKRRTKRATR
jgi:hypothetical protein